MKTCPGCKAQIIDTAKFCNKCGFNVKKYEEEKASDKAFCTECGAQIPCGSAFCPECGFQVGTEVSADIAAPALTESFADTSSGFDTGWLSGLEVSSEREELRPFEYVDHNNGTYTVTGLRDKHLPAVVVPDGVIAIGDGAFEGSEAVSIELPEGLSKIGNGAFKGLKDLCEISLPSSLLLVGDEAFMDCQSLDIELPPTVRKVGKDALKNTSCDILRKRAEDERRARERRIAEAERKADTERKRAEEERLSKKTQNMICSGENCDVWISDCEISGDLALITLEAENKMPNAVNIWFDSPYEGNKWYDAFKVGGLDANSSSSMRFEVARSMLDEDGSVTFDLVVSDFDDEENITEEWDVKINVDFEKQCVKLANENEIRFGRYDHGDEVKDIRWIVLERRGNTALLLSKYVIDCKRFNEELQKVSWENCSLRKWLNGEFLNTAFSADEKSRILKSTVTTEPNRYSGVGIWPKQEAFTTFDKIFLLSTEEVEKYFKTDEETQSRPTYYSKPLFEDSIDWWLRSSGIYQDHTDYVPEYGGTSAAGKCVDSKYTGVRPAMWIKIK